MSAARLILLPLFVIDVTTLAQAAVARAVEKLSISSTAAALTDLPTIAIDVDKDRGSQIVLAAEKSSTESIAKSANSKAGNEKSAAIPAAPKALSGEKDAVIAQSPMPKKPNAPASKSEEQRSSAEKSPSILQMLEGHESEILAAAAIALAFFFIGWICGGNYYLRRDRRQRTKLRF